MKGLIEVDNRNDFEKSQDKKNENQCDSNGKDSNQWESDVWEPYEWPTIEWNPEEYEEIKCIKEDTFFGSDVGSPSSSTSSSMTSLNSNDKESGFNSIDDDESWNVELFDPNRPYGKLQSLIIHL